MRTDEALLATLFVLLVGSVFAAAAWELLRLLLERFAKREKPKRPWWRRTILSLATFGFACIAWGFLVEPNWPEVTHVRIPAAVPAPVRIVHLSDLHCDPAPRLEDRLPALVAAEKPDLIVFTGDSVNSPAGLPIFRRTMAGLAKVAPTFAVGGNWDVWYWNALDLLGGTGVTEIDGTQVALDVRGTTVLVGGIAYGNRAGMAPALLRRDGLRVFLCHTPDDAPAAADLGADLVLAGHTHGGQVALPLLGPILTLTKVGRGYARGLRPMGSAWLYTSRGIGMEGGSAPRVRFCARPEIAVIDVVPR